MLYEVITLLPELIEVSDAWLKEKNTREKGFSIGYFDDGYLRRFPLGVITSYSIHYTKLYEGCSSPRPVAGDSGVLIVHRPTTGKRAGRKVKREERRDLSHLTGFLPSQGTSVWHNPHPRTWTS